MKTRIERSFDQLEGAWAAAGFSLVLIVVGLPIWWWTTTVYRAGLPYSTIDVLSSHSPYHTLHVLFIADKPLSFKDQMESHLKSKDPYIRFLISARPPDNQEKHLLQSSESVESLESSLQFKRIYHAGSLTIYLLPQNSSLVGSSEISVSKKRAIFLQENTDLMVLSEVIHSMTLEPLAKLGLKRHGQKLLHTVEQNEKIQIMRQVPTEPGYDVTLTLMLPQPHLVKAKWDISKAVQDYLDPLVNQLKGISELRIRSQVLYMTSMKINPRWSSKYKHYSLPEQQLPLTINAIEAKLGSFVSTRPSLHFIIYVPSEHQSPLQIHTKDGRPLPSNSFLVPRWGGVLIHNPPPDLLTNKENKTLPQTFPVDSQRVMSTFISQLHKLFPIPFLENHNITFIGEKYTNTLMDWQLDGLARARVLSYLHNIRITLQSLCDLVGEISNMVVSDEVAGWVWAAVADWDACLQASREGRLKEATEYCKDAFVYSDAAFFHPSMLALLYFPDNQKYAIYVPLFLPVSIPVVLSLRTIWKLFRFRKDKIE